MKEALKIARFDYLTTKTLALPAWLITAALCGVLGLFISPMMGAMVSVGALVFIVPLHSAAEKSDFAKLYGILPVQRKSITHGRFLFLFLSLFVSELVGLLVVFLAMQLQLYRILPNQETSTMRIVAETFNPEKFSCYGAVIGCFTVLCIAFSYMEMMGQIFGRENDMKIIMITLSVITVLALGFFWLSDHGIIPTIRLNIFNLSYNGQCILGIVLNIAVLALNILFSKITANKISVREL